MGQGFAHAPPANSPAAATFRRMAQCAAARNRAIMENVNRFLGDVAVDYERDVLPLTPSGNATERHLLLAYDLQAQKQMPQRARRAQFWASKLGMAGPEVELLMNDAIRFRENDVETDHCRAGRRNQQLVQRFGGGPRQGGHATDRQQHEPTDRHREREERCRERTLAPWLRGGSQERGRRGGTHNVAGIAGLGVAAELARREMNDRAGRYASLRDRLWSGIEAKVPRVRRNGAAAYGLPNTLCVEFRDAAGDVLLEALDGEGIAVSAGAACASGSVHPSRTLLAMGRSIAEARASLRFSVGHGTTEAQIERVLALLPDLVARVRSLETVA
jgi:hypothetical protein